MKAIVYTEFGPPEVLRYVEMARREPGDDEVLLRVRAASLNALDWRLMRGRPFLARMVAGALRHPRITPGVDVAGEIEAVGRRVVGFMPGQAVFGTCRGTLADYACALPERIAAKPANVSFEAAAAVPVAATTALQGLRDKGGIRAGHRVLVDGASGGVGTFAVQIAKAFGAEVTAVCSTGNLAAARALGADHVIDYTREDFADRPQRYDLILAANAHRSILDYRRALAPGGTCVMAGGGGYRILQALLLAPLLALSGRRWLRILFARIDRADLDLLRDWLADGRLVPAIDRRYPLREAAEALRYAAQGHARGKVVVDVLRGGES